MCRGFWYNGVECQETHPTCFPVPPQLSDKAVVTRYFPTWVVIVWLYDPLGQRWERYNIVTLKVIQIQLPNEHVAILFHDTPCSKELYKKIFDVSILNAGKCIISLLWKLHRAFRGNRMAGR